MAVYESFPMKKLILLTLSFFILFLSFKNAGVMADELSDLEKRIAEYQQQIDLLQNQEKNLNQQISLMDNQIKVAALRITETQNKIKTLEQEITLLSGKIIRLEESLNYISKILLKRVAETYKSAKSDPLILLLTSKNFSDFIFRFRYLQTVQIHDRELLLSMEQTRTNYDEQKTMKEKIQEETTKLNLQLINQKKQLASQVDGRKKLLDETKQDEKKYQQLLVQAYAEKAAIEKALVSGVKVGPVKRGDPIALVGNSGYPGCSTGKHLHFEIRKNNSWVDPGPYLSGKSVKDEQDNKGTVNIGLGSWPWPIEDTVRLTQFYGQTPYSWRYKYSGGIHTGYDMISTSSDVIRAPADGTLFKSSQMCGTSNINIVYIEHSDNIISFYLHVQ